MLRAHLSSFTASGHGARRLMRRLGLSLGQTLGQGQVLGQPLDGSDSDSNNGRGLNILPIIGGVGGPGDTSPSGDDGNGSDSGSGDGSSGTSDGNGSGSGSTNTDPFKTPGPIITYPPTMPTPGSGTGSGTGSGSGSGTGTGTGNGSGNGTGGGTGTGTGSGSDSGSGTPTTPPPSSSRKDSNKPAPSPTPPPDDGTKKPTDPSDPAAGTNTSATPAGGQNSTTPKPTPLPVNGGGVVVSNSTANNTGNANQTPAIVAVPTPGNTTNATNAANATNATPPANNTTPLPVGTVTTTAGATPAPTGGTLTSGANQSSGGGSNINAGEIIGITAGALAGLVILGWLLSFPLRQAASRKRAVEWLDFNPKHGTGEPDEDDDDRPMNSAEAVLGRAPTMASNGRSDPTYHEGTGMAAPRSYEMSQVAGHSYNTGLSYGMPEAQYPYGPVGMGYDGMQGGWYGYGNTPGVTYGTNESYMTGNRQDMAMAQPQQLQPHAVSDDDAYDVSAGGMDQSFGDGGAMRKPSAGASSVTTTYLNHSPQIGGGGDPNKSSPPMAPSSPIRSSPSPGADNAMQRALPQPPVSPVVSRPEREGSLIESPSLDRLGKLHIVNHE